jgi:hypothetical protein
MHVSKVCVSGSRVAANLLQPSDAKSAIGLALCKAETRVIAEDGLRDIATPMGVSESKLPNHPGDRSRSDLKTLFPSTLPSLEAS